MIFVLLKHDRKGLFCTSSSSVTNLRKTFANWNFHFIAVPICLSNLHCGASLSSAQYSSNEIILSLTILINDVTWNETLLSFGYTLATVTSKLPISSIRSTTPSHSPGYSQLAIIYSSRLKCSFVQCQFIYASS